MNLSQIDIYKMNIAAELVMCLMLFFLLASCLLNRQRKETIRTLNVLMFMNLLLMVCQIVEWILMIVRVNDPVSVVPPFYGLKKLVYTVDYSLYYFVSVSFFNYVKVHIKDLAVSSGKNIHIRKSWNMFLIVWGIIVTVVFAVCINQKWFYFIDSNGMEMFHKMGYLALYALGWLGTLSSTILLIINRAALGRRNMIMLLIYIVTPPLFVIIDLKNGTCFTYLLLSFYTFVLYIHMDLRQEKVLDEKEKQLLMQEQELTELNTQIMLSQMQPHFLYNTLSTISGLCYMEGAEKAKHVVDKFAEYFRENLDALGKEKYILFEKELEHIQTYLWLEQIRFGEALNIEYDIDVTNFYIPSLSIQPLVENAVKHGIRMKKGGGTVNISTKEIETEYLIIISDDGAGYSVGEIPDDGRSHTGIENIKKRIQILNNGTCDIESEIGKGTTVTVHIPKTMEEKA